MTMGNPTITNHLAAKSGESTSQQKESLPALLRRQGQWLFIIIPYLFAWGLPFVWSWNEWTSPRHILFFQPFVPLLIVVLMWSRREVYATIWQRLSARPETKFWLRGNSVLLSLGCVVLTFSHLVQIKGIAVIGLLLIGWGVVYRVYGFRLLQALWVPLSISLLTIPWPDTIADKMGQLVNSKTLSVAAFLLRFLRHTSFPTIQKLNFPDGGYIVDYGGTEGGLGLITLCLVGSLFFGLLRRYDLNRITLFLILSLSVSLIVNLFRVIVAGFLGGTAPTVAQILAQSPPVILLTIAVSFLMTVFVEWVIIRIRERSALSRKAPPDRTFGQSTRGVSQVGTLWKRSERGLENALRKIPKSPFNPFVLLGRGWKLSEKTIEKGFRLLSSRKKKSRRR